MKENNALLRLDGVGVKTDDAVILHNINFQLRCSAQPPGACFSTMRMSRRCRRKGIANRSLTARRRRPCSVIRFTII